jgi:formylglycine-generating enzyme required for sulfatase activity
MDQTEVTNAQFTHFVATTGYTTDAEIAGWGYAFMDNQWRPVNGADWRHPGGPTTTLAGLDNLPVVLVSWNDANAYCQWAGRQLPTEAQWEKAARGTDGRIYPWGNQNVAGNLLNFADLHLGVSWADKTVNDGYEFTAPVGSYPAGASPYGVLDLAGNVWEWVADWYADKYYAESPAQNPPGPSSGQGRVMRGGGWSDVAARVRAASRRHEPPDSRHADVGFRCSR